MNFSAHKFALGFFGSVLVAWLLVMVILVRHAALPAEASGTMLVVFEPRISEIEAVHIIAEAQGKIVKQTGVGFAWLVQDDAPGLAGRLRANGALGAYRELPIPIEMAGCLAVIDAKVASAIN
ncbi:MAG TPA: hypothetical protein VII21_01545 [Aestuariivirga sp.]